MNYMDGDCEIEARAINEQQESDATVVINFTIDDNQLIINYSFFANCENAKDIAQLCQKYISDIFTSSASKIKND